MTMCDYDVRLCKRIIFVAWPITLYFLTKFAIVDAPAFVDSMKLEETARKQEIRDMLGSIRVEHSGYIYER